MFRSLQRVLWVCALHIAKCLLRPLQSLSIYKWDEKVKEIIGSLLDKKWPGRSETGDDSIENI